MGLTLQEVLMRALMKLDDSGFQRFIEKLSQWEVRKEYKNIPKDELTGKDPEHVAGLINEYYKYAYGAEVTIDILEDIEQKKVQEELQKDLKEDYSYHGFVDLDSDSEEEFEEFPQWSYSDYSYHGFLDLDSDSEEEIEEFPQVSNSAGFLEKHRLDLISKVIIVDPILDDLREQGLLGDKQYQLLRREPSIKKKMTELLDIVSNWEENSKKKFFTSLCAHNPCVIMDLERTEKKEAKGLTDYDLSAVTEEVPDRSDESDWNRRRKAFSEEAPHRSDESDWNLGRTDTHPHKHFDPFRNYSQYLYQKEEKKKKKPFALRRIDELFSKLKSNQKDVQFETQSHAPDYYYSNLMGRDPKHFVDEQCWDLIRRIILVDPVIEDLLEQNLVTQEQFDALMKLKTPQKKMIDLYVIAMSWTNPKKDQFYLALRQHNPAFIRVLEKSNQILKSSNQNKGSHYQKLTLDLETGSSYGEHFLDKNKLGLINVMSTVDPVVEDLKEEGLLTEEQYHNILLKESSKEKMEEIYNISDSFDNVKKDKVYLSLRTHNRSHIRVIERISKPSLSVSEQSVSGYGVKRIDLVSEENDDLTLWKVPGFILFTIICCICKEMYKNPVTLICGHNYCLECIEKTWNNQDSDDTSCPICRRRFKNRPELRKNLVLCQIAEFCESSKSDKKTHERCTYCTFTCKINAVKQCLLCEAFLCEEHLNVHSKQAEHVLLDPSVSQKNKKCSIHRTVFQYYCCQDSACVCSHCCIVGEHKGHQVIPIGEAMEIKKDKLRDIEENLKLKKSETEKSIKMCMQKVQAKVHTISELGTDVVEDQEIREIVKLVQRGLLIEEGQAEYLVEDLIRQLEAKSSHLSQCIAHIEEQCYETDPFLVLQDQEDYNL